ncbi:MAG TPA: hypothetical protein VIY73_10360 [Polyangiaceae bacterium]
MSATIQYRCSYDQQGANAACSDFTADTLAHAQSLAQILATLLQRSVWLVGGATTSGAPVLYTPATAGSALGSAPTGIAF